MHLNREEQKTLELKKEKVDLLVLDDLSFCKSRGLQDNVIHKLPYHSLETLVKC